MPLTGGVRDARQLFQDGLLSGNSNSNCRMNLELNEGAAAAGGELLIGGQSRFSLPENSVIHLDIVLTGWKDSNVPVVARRQFGFARTTGAPSNLTLTGATIYSSFPAGETFSVDPQANGDLQFNFDGANNSEYRLTADVRYSFSGEAFSPSTANKVVNG